MVVGSSLALGAVCALVGAELLRRASRDLEPWHRLRTQEAKVLVPTGPVQSFADYLAWENDLFDAELARLDLEVERWPAWSRFDSDRTGEAGSGSPNWNRSVVLDNEEPVGGVLLLHGLSDSPYSLQSIGHRLHSEGWTVVAPRMPGHGLYPGALAGVGWKNWQWVVDLAIADLRERVGEEQPIVLLGYSNGAALALEATLRGLQAEDSWSPDRLVFLSPALAVSGAARYGSIITMLSHLPGLKSLAWQDVVPEYDPYKYNSFPVRAGLEIYRLIDAVEERLRQLESRDRLDELPPLLTLQSAVDSTVPPVASLERLYRRIQRPESELVVFDANRRSSVEDFLTRESGALLRLVEPDSQFPFSATLITNRDRESDTVVSIHRPAASTDTFEEPLDLSWPAGIYSLSHVAIPFPPDDPVYGRGAVAGLGLGGIEVKGERGILLVPASLLSRLRYNPFYSVVEDRMLEFLSPLVAEGGTPKKVATDPVDSGLEFELVVSRFLDAMVEGDGRSAGRQLDHRVLLVAGGGSSDPTQWEAHLDVEGASWPAALLSEAGPVETDYRILSSHERGGAAVVAVEETGKNRFRSYVEEIVVYQLRTVDEDWKISGIFWADVGNPPDR